MFTKTPAAVDMIAPLNNDAIGNILLSLSKEIVEFIQEKLTSSQSTINY